MFALLEQRAETLADPGVLQVCLKVGYLQVDCLMYGLDDLLVLVFSLYPLVPDYSAPTRCNISFVTAEYACTPALFAA